MSEDNFILHSDFNKFLSRQTFELAKDKYIQSLATNKFAIKDVTSIYDLINAIKRTPEKIGPYQNISIFEALNRIGSDLVLLSGAEKLFNGFINEIVPKSIHLKMGTTHGFDFEVKLADEKIIYGEAFNAAESFGKQKMRQALHKLIDKNPDKNAKNGIIFMNEDLEGVLKEFQNKKERENTKIKIHKVFCGKIY